MGEAFYEKGRIANLRRLRQLDDQAFAAFSQFDTAAFAPGDLDLKTKELIAVACAHVTRCPWCIDAHTARARKAGATGREIAEAVFVSVAMNAGAAMAHSCIAMGALADD